MSRKILIVASVISFMEWFERDIIRELAVNQNWEVHIACNMDYLQDTSISRTGRFVEEYSACGVVFHNIKFARSPFSRDNLTAYRQIRQLINSQHWDIIHCHTPMASVLTRLAVFGVRQRGTKVVYTSHGFHFFRGAGLLGWLVYYPMEKICSFVTDVLFTINQEDFSNARKMLHARRVEYIPGVGIDVGKFNCTACDAVAKRQELGLPEDAALLLSVGELNVNKNHAVVIRALAALHKPRLHYVVAGKGPLLEDLKNLAKKLGVAGQVHLLGFREDVAEFYKTADVFVFPSFREGLPASLMEAMASGLPCVVSRIRGNVDLVDEPEGGYYFDPQDDRTLVETIDKLLLLQEQNYLKKASEYNVAKAWHFDKAIVLQKVLAVYADVLSGVEDA